MRKLVIFSLAVAVLLIVVGCGYREGTRQPDNQSYIWFSGNTDGAVAIIDGDESSKVDLTYYTNGSGKTLYEVKHGKHEVMVKRNGVVVVHRIFMISSGATKEVRVP